jgi:phage baseplate assembly protein W
MSFDLSIVSGDLVIANGALQTVTNSAKLIQDILKICLTDVGANPIHPSYGSFLSKTVIGNPAKPGIIVQIAKSQINTCLVNLQSLQQLQLKNFQKVSADEQLGAILGVSVVQSKTDPRLYNIFIKVLTKGYQPVSTQFSVTTI